MTVEKGVMSPEAFRELISQCNSSDTRRPCLILGNGFNLQFYKTKNVANEYNWKNFLLAIAKRNGIRGIEHLFGNPNISYTEIADFMESCGTTAIESLVMEEIGKMYEMNFDDKICRLLDCAWEHNFHILTTNFDGNIEQYLRERIFKSKNGHITKHTIAGESHQSKKGAKSTVVAGGGKKRPDTSPGSGRIQFQWNCFYSDTPDAAKLGFDTDVHKLRHDVWHIHGGINTKGSRGILFTSTKYAGAINHYQRLGGYAENNPRIQNTWLKLFFECPLIFAGLGMTQQEIFLRHLVLQRYYCMRQKDCQPSFYLCSGKSDTKDGRVFMKEAGITPVRFSREKSIYSQKF